MGTADFVHDASYAIGKQERGYTTFSEPKSNKPAAAPNQAPQISPSAQAAPQYVGLAGPRGSAAPKSIVHSNVAAQSQGVTFSDQAKAAIQKVKSDREPENWQVEKNGC